MNTKTAHKIIAAGGMAAVIAIGTTVFFMRSPPVAPIAVADVTATPAAEAPAVDPSATAELPSTPAPATDAPFPAAAPAASDTATAKPSERAIPPVSDAKRVPRRESANAMSQLDTSSRTVARNEPMATAAEKPAVTERADTSASTDTAPVTSTSPSAIPDVATSAPVVASDTQITTEVKTAIANEGLTKDASIAVTTTDGVVALSGSVPSQAAIEQVKDVAAKVKDVKRVDTSGLLLASL